MTLAVLTSLFNPCQYQRRWQNYHTFRQRLQAQSIPLYTIELAFADAPFALTPADNIVQRRTQSILWHKERLLNLLESYVPSTFTALAWIDADLLFEQDHWHEQTLQALQRYPIVQPFSHSRWQDANGAPAFERQSLAYVVSQQGRSPEATRNSDTGLAWAMRRDVWRTSSLWDGSIIGSGDTLMCCAMYGWTNHPALHKLTEAQRKRFVEWAKPFGQAVRGRVTHITGTVTHLWHGARENRAYSSRHNILHQHHFDPQRDLHQVHGIWEWTDPNSPLSREVQDYFQSRREDG